MHAQMFSKAFDSCEIQKIRALFIIVLYMYKEEMLTDRATIKIEDGHEAP